MRLRDLGKPWFSWTDLRAIVHRARTDWTMELFRVTNPDTWLWSDPSAMLLTEIATIASDMRYFAAKRFDWAGYEDGEVPERFWAARYGPPRAEPVETETVRSDDVDKSRQVAAAMRG